jgi:hypothetical protein
LATCLALFQVGADRQGTVRKNSKYLEIEMKFVGVLLAVCGWLLPVASLTLTSSLAARFIFALIGIAMCLTGILGFLNRAYVKEAIWKK